MSRGLDPIAWGMPLGILILGLASPSLRAEGNPGATAAGVLQIPLGARAVGMGGAFTGVASDLSALYYNPAGLSNLNRRELGFMYLKGFEDQTLQFIGAATPLPFSGIIGNGYATLGAGLLLSDNGKIEVNRTNPDGSLLDNRTINAGGDMVATLGYSERIADFSFDTKDGPYNMDHFLGVNAKFIRSTLAETYSATAFAGDMGYFIKAPELGTSFGLSMANLGTKMRFISEGDPLPLTTRAGLAFEPRIFDALTLPPEQRLTVAGDVNYAYYERQWHGNVGLEYSAFRLYSLRVGYQLNQDVAGLTVGFGVGWRGLSIDYAWAMTDAFSDTHRFSLTYRFGAISARARAAARRPYIESMPEREDIKSLNEQTPRTIEPPKRPRPSETGNPGWIY